MRGRSIVHCGATKAVAIVVNITRTILTLSVASSGQSILRVTEVRDAGATVALANRPKFGACRGVKNARRRFGRGYRRARDVFVSWQQIERLGDLFNDVAIDDGCV